MLFDINSIINNKIDIFLHGTQQTSFTYFDEGTSSGQKYLDPFDFRHFIEDIETCRTNYSCTSGIKITCLTSYFALKIFVRQKFKGPTRYRNRKISAATLYHKMLEIICSCNKYLCRLCMTRICICVRIVGIFIKKKRFF